MGGFEIYAEAVPLKKLGYPIGWGIPL
jgi:hypothetical protein